MSNIPIVQAQPVFAGVTPVDVPVELKGNPNITPELWGVIQNSEVMTIRQHVKLLPKNCCSCPPCPPQENTYSVYAGLTKDAEAEIFRIDEVSDDWNRCCCKPYHPLKLEVRQYVPMPGDTGHSDFSHLAGDVARDFSGFTKGRKQEFLRDYYRQQPVLFTMQRDDGMRCCLKCPCKWLDFMVCFKCCQDGMHLYAGETPGHPEGKEPGRPYGSETPQIGSVIQPILAGWCTPTLHLAGSNDEEPFGKIQGPYCFGGWSECCCDFQFWTSRFDSPTKTGDLALITKKKPSSLTGGLIELMTDSDVYTIQFADGAGLTAAQKATIMAGQVLADYMFFDGNTDKCGQDDNFVYCYCFYCSFFGWLRPCYVAIPKKAG